MKGSFHEATTCCGGGIKLTPPNAALSTAPCAVDILLKNPWGGLHRCGGEGRTHAAREGCTHAAPI